MGGAAQPGVRILFYAINGTGLGHLTRLLALARRARTLIEGLGLRAELAFLTTSDGVQAAADFPVYKLPSKQSAARSGFERRDFLAASKLFVSNAISGLRPDILVVDTVPEGAFGEMSFLRSYARATAFIDRRKDRALAEAPVHQKHLELYDSVLVPDRAEAQGHYPASPSVAARRHFIGPVLGLRPELAWTPGQVREHFAVPEGRRLIYLSAGGGGDGEATLDRLVLALGADPRNHLLVGYGPLFRGRRRYGPNIVALGEADASRYFAGVHAAVSAAGYNSYQELLAARVPTLFFAQRRGMDRQDERIAEGLAAGWHREVDPALPDEELRSAVDTLFDEDTRAALLQALDARARPEGDLRGAVALLELHASLPRSPVKLGALRELAAWRLSYREDAQLPFDTAAYVARRWLRLACSEAARQARKEASAAAWRREAPDEADGALLRFTAAIAERAEALGFDSEALESLLRTFCHEAAARDAVGEKALRDRLRALLDGFMDGLGAADSAILLHATLAHLHRSSWRDAMSRLAADVDAGARPDVDALAARLAPLGRISGLQLRRLLEESPTPEEKQTHAHQG